jgi:hypothetical protein
MQTFAAKAGSPVICADGAVSRRHGDRDRREEWVGGCCAWDTVRLPEESQEMSRRAEDMRMFSVYISGRAMGDGDVLKVGYVVEQGTRVREKLKVYMEPRVEIGDV